MPQYSSSPFGLLFVSWPHYHFPPPCESLLTRTNNNRNTNFPSQMHKARVGRGTAVGKVIHTIKALIQVDEDDIFWRQKKGKEELAGSQNSAHVTSLLAQYFTIAMVGLGPRSWIAGLFNRSGNKLSGSDKFLDRRLTPPQEERLQRLQERINIPFDETRLDHQASLLALWKAGFPNVTLKGLISEQWKDMGWQGPNPSTDFRLLFKKGGKRAEWEYPFAVAGINVSFMLIQMLDLYAAKPKCLSGMNFLRLLGENEEAFDILYCVAFAMMDAQWLAMKASYMEFNDVLKVTRTQLERELSLEDIRRIQDLPAYNLLFH